MAVDDEEWGVRKIGRREAVGLGMGELVFVTRKEEELADIEEEGEMWDEGKWERRALHIQRMELIKRATAPVRLTQPSATKIFDVMTTALTRNKVQLFLTRRRPKLWELDTDTEMTTIVE